MPRILLSASFPEELLIRQTPGRTGRWQDFEFLTEPTPEPVDGWVVVDNLRLPLTQRVALQNTLLITGEPESLRRYRARFTGQFGRVWTSHQSIRHRRVVRRHEAQHWHYGLFAGSVHGQQLDFDSLRTLPRPEKTKLLSVICSSKISSDDHRQRLSFVEHLKAELGDMVDVFGRGIRSMDDKSEAIYNYRYHVVLENDHSDHFMTEKLGDAFLGWSYPIYFGGSEASYNYPPGSFTAIDIYKPEEAVQMIRSVVAAETYEASLDAIAAARQRVLFENNFCQLLADYWREQAEPVSVAPTVTLVPKQHRLQLTWRQLERWLPGRAA